MLEPFTELLGTVEGSACYCNSYASLVELDCCWASDETGSKEKNFPKINQRWFITDVSL